MPASWMTEEQLNFLNGELPGFQAAQHQQCGPGLESGPSMMHCILALQMHLLWL